MLARHDAPTTTLAPASKISVVVPVYNERDNIATCLRGLWRALQSMPHEILVCYDFDEDTTLQGIAAMNDAPPSLRLVKNTIGRGAANALRSGFAAATGDVVVTTMADLSDPPENIPRMAELMRRENLAVVAGSRYMRGGSQTGGPILKRTLSRIAGVSLDWIAGVGTKDATSNFRAYSKAFLDSVTIESRAGFEIALELTVKAHLAHRGVGEVPSSWSDRTAGESRFRLWKWMPNYLRWWLRAAWQPLVVWLTWIVTSVMVCSYVGTHASRIPQLDDMELVPVVTPKFQWSIDWLWALHNEHRVPLSRAIVGPLFAATHDIRWPMFVDVALLSGLTLAFVLVARKLRGKTTIVDALFPLLLLHTGNAENLLMAFQMALILPTVLVCTLVFLALRAPLPQLSSGRALAMGLCLIALPLLGGPGITQMPALFAGVALLALWIARRGSKRAALVLGVATALTIALTALYATGYSPPLDASPRPTLMVVLSTAAHVMTLALGLAGPHWWPWSGIALLVLAASTLWILARAWRGRVGERARIAALLCSFAATVSLALAIGWGRGGGGDVAGFAPRYVTLPAPWIAMSAFAWILYGGRIGRVFVPAALALGSLAANITANEPFGGEYGAARDGDSHEIAADIVAGMPPPRFLDKWTDRLYPSRPRLHLLLAQMAEANLPPFDGATEAVRKRYAGAVFDLPIAHVESPLPIERRWIADMWDGVVVPTDSRLTLDVPANARHFSGSFGVVPRWIKQGKTRGVRAQVRLVTATDAAGRIVFDKAIDPIHVASERSPQKFDLALEPAAGSQIVLSITWRDETARDVELAYWAELFFE